MALKKHKPNTPGTRGKKIVDSTDLTTNKPCKELLKPQKNTGGRNNQGKVTVTSRGGGVKQKYRLIDFKRDKYKIEGTVKTIEYDPNRTSFISLINYIDGEKRYILTPQGIKIGDKIISGEKVDIKLGNSLPLKNIPLGSIIHCVEMHKNKGAQLIRTAGSSGILTAKVGKHVHVKLPSGEVRIVLDDCFATLGSLANEDHSNEDSGKAGRTRKRGFRPHTRGAAKNRCDHPHGGGEGKAPVGNKSPMTPKGKCAIGKKTRKTVAKHVIKKRK